MFLLKRKIIDRKIFVIKCKQATKLVYLSPLVGDFEQNIILNLKESGNQLIEIKSLLEKRNIFRKKLLIKSYFLILESEGQLRSVQKFLYFFQWRRFERLFCILDAIFVVVVSFFKFEGQAQYVKIISWLNYLRKTNKYFNLEHKNYK